MNRSQRLLVTGWSIAACGIVCLIVVGFSVMMSLVYPTWTLFITGLVLTLLGVAGVVVASVLARTDGREPQPLPPSRRNAATLCAIAGIVCGIVISVGMVAVTNAAAAPASTAIPDTRMTVEQAAQAYLDATLRHDCWYTSTHTDRNTNSWCSDPTMTDAVGLDTPQAVGPPMVDRREWCASFEMTTNGDSQGSLPAGDQPWGYCFVKEHGVWMLWDQGMG